MFILYSYQKVLSWHTSTPELVTFFKAVDNVWFPHNSLIVRPLLDPTYPVSGMTLIQCPTLVEPTRGYWNLIMQWNFISQMLMSFDIIITPWSTNVFWYQPSGIYFHIIFQLSYIGNRKVQTHSQNDPSIIWLLLRIWYDISNFISDC